MVAQKLGEIQFIEPKPVIGQMGPKQAVFQITIFGFGLAQRFETGKKTGRGVQTAVEKTHRRGQDGRETPHPQVRLSLDGQQDQVEKNQDEKMDLQASVTKSQCVSGGQNR